MSSHIGDFLIQREKFKNCDEYFKEFRSPFFTQLPEQKKVDRISEILHALILEAGSEKFLLPAVTHFIEQVNEAKVADLYTFSHFEFWLNHVAGFSFEENFYVRAQIVGKRVSRADYQHLFPIGMGKFFSGSHFVTAHSSPDIDTTVASFWGWVDAFGARVSEGLHVWNVPGGAPSAQVEIDLLFYKVFGPSLFSLVAKNRSSLSVSALDLVSQQGVLKKEEHESSQDLDLESEHQAVILVNSEGYYLGDWRSIDVERVRFVINLLNQCLRWYENDVHVKLVSLFAKQDLRASDFQEFLRKMFDLRLSECSPVKEYSKVQKQLLETYLSKVLGVSGGMESTIFEFGEAIRDLGLTDFFHFIEQLKEFEKAHIFDAKGLLIEGRPKLFHFLAEVISGLDKAIYKIRQYVDRLGVAGGVKSSVLGLNPQYVNYRADVEEIKSKINGYPYLTVTSTTADGKIYPLGVIYATDLYKSSLGTVSLRDFSNREETKIPSYLEIISVIDHHKMALSSSTPPMVSIGDVQSSNTLVAEASFVLNDRYSTGGMTLIEIEKQIDFLKNHLNTPGSHRLLKRVLTRHLAFEQKGDFFISIEREFTEYLHFLYAILDDTDLLTKVALRDVECVASLLNRLKSLSLRQEIEVVHFDDIAKDSLFVKKAAERLLQNDELYSLYQKIYLAKEEAVEENLKLCLAGKNSTIFADTKEQNGCCRVGQTKMFARNFLKLEKQASLLCKIWWQQALKVFQNKKEIDLHLHMMSTIPGADELYQGQQGKHSHKDEIWIWIPETDVAIEHLKSFLNALRASPHLISQDIDVEFWGENEKVLDQIFEESFMPRSKKTKSHDLPIAVLRFPAGMINSRKAMISPYLPHLL